MTGSSSHRRHDLSLPDFVVQTKLNLMALVEIFDNARCKLFDKYSGFYAPRTHKNLTNHFAVITGGNRGVGLATAEELVKCGSDVVLACRSVETGEKAALELRKLAPYDGIDRRGSVEVERVDLADLASVRHLVNRMLEKQRAVDLVVCNAGIMTPPDLQITQDGFEIQFQANYLSHFLMVHELLRGLKPFYEKNNRQPRVVVLSSLTHHGAKFNLGDGSDFPKVHSYVPFREYANSKLCNLLFAKELNRRLDGQHAAFPSGAAVAVHPGLVDTMLAKDYFTSTVPAVLRPIVTPILERCVFPLFLRTTKAAAETVMYACTAANSEVGGKYVAGHGVVVSSSRSSEDVVLAAKLWDISCHLSKLETDDL